MARPTERLEALWVVVGTPMGVIYFCRLSEALRTIKLASVVGCPKNLPSDRRPVGWELGSAVGRMPRHESLGFCSRAKKLFHTPLRRDRPSRVGPDLAGPYRPARP